MASLYSNTLLIIIITLLLNASAHNLHPTFSPKHIGNVCSEVACGKGNCKPIHDTIFGFECECEEGWKQAFKFLPCVIPNCTLNYSCGGTTVENENDHTSIFDMCHWVDCGMGICNKTSPLSYACECSDGYSNLLNVKAFPCLNQCTFGMDCKVLGVGLSNTTVPSPPSSSLSDSSSAKGRFIVGGRFDWLITIAAPLAAIYVFV